MKDIDYRVQVPEGASGDWLVERFTVDENAAALERMRMFNPSSRGRGVPEGTYTRLMHGGTVVMSDTPDEIRDHREPIWHSKGRVLLNGLGLGVVLGLLLNNEQVEHVDVVEKAAAVIQLVGPSYDDPRVTIHCADAFEQAKSWPRGSHWTVAWHDIWNHLSTDNLPDMHQLHRSYGRRTDWQGSWGRELIEAYA